MGKDRKASKRKGRSPITWAQAFRDVAMRIVDKGQLIALTIGLSMFVLAMKTPPEHAADVFKACLEALRSHHIYGWIAFCIVLVASLLTIKAIRRSHTKECERIGLEKSRLQERLLGTAVKSSNRSH